MKTYLEINDAGSWRRVMSFDVRAASHVAAHATSLLGCSDNPRIRARIIESQGTTAPLMTWSAQDGWRMWDER
jgi:hypothetical protein